MHGYRCPIDQGELHATADALTCASCGQGFPIIGGVPILLNEQNSVFRISDYTNKGQTYGGASAYGASADETTGIKRLYRKLVHALSEGGVDFRKYGAPNAVAEILQKKPGARLLVVGSGESTFAGDAVYTDVAFGKNVTCICDAHDLPFADREFDLVLACAVLEHVADPQRCVQEIWRVLNDDGCVYAETPFLQPVHMREYDFTRFTFLGHRRLFHQFDDIRSGIAGGPGLSLAYVLRGSLRSLTNRRLTGAALHLLGLLISHPLRLLDVWLLRQPSAYDSASALYFFGRKRQTTISDRDILAFYRGG